ncbi:hypothetical protein ACNKHT_03565 [Shigella flexneri]
MDSVLTCITPGSSVDILVTDQVSQLTRHVRSWPNVAGSGH